VETIYCKNKDEWRAWLEQNYKSTNIIWLIYFKKHTKKETVSYNDAVEEALCYGWIDSTVKSIDKETYMQKYTPRKAKSMWSLINKNRVKKLIRENKMTKAGMEQVDIAKKNGQWEKAYTTQKDVELPSYLEKALKADEKAWMNFSNFAKSYQNQYINWVTNAKRIETREKRIAIVIDRCSQNKKSEMM
jgi:uncharacterized protein YdeI (YjbR/CyaY-like superfamily)